MRSFLGGTGRCSDRARSVEIAQGKYDGSGYYHLQHIASCSNYDSMDDGAVIPSFEGLTCGLLSADSLHRV